MPFRPTMSSPFASSICGPQRLRCGTSVDSLGGNRTRAEGMGGGGRSSRIRTFVRNGPQRCALAACPFCSSLPHLHTPCPAVTMSADDCRRSLYRFRFLTANTRGATLPSVTLSSRSLRLQATAEPESVYIQDDFDDSWVASIITVSFAKRSPDTIIPPLHNGELLALESRGAEAMGHPWMSIPHCVRACWRSC